MQVFTPAATLTVALSLLAVGCVEVPVADSLLHEDAAEVDYDYAHIPDGERIEVAREDVEVAPGEQDAADPADRPRVIVSRYDASLFEDEYSEDGVAHGTALCPFEVSSVGLPAVDASGEVVATLVNEVLSSSDGEDELVTFRRQAIGNDANIETTVVLDGDAAPGRYHCRNLYKQARAHAALINATLDEGGFRAMERFPVALRNGRADDTFFDPEQESDSESDLEARPAPDQRPVEIVPVHDDVVLRIPGVKVFARRSALGWGEVDDDPDMGGCWYEEPYVQSAFADRDAGVVLLQVDQMGGPCFCYAATEHYTWSIGRETVERVFELNLSLARSPE
jgi:hypothetical protein